MGALHLCWCLGLVLLVLPNLDARNVKIVPAETKTITTNGATHEISRYILVPDDQNNGNGAKTIANAIKLQIASRTGADKAQSETANVKSDDIKDLNEINRVKTDNAKESKIENVHDVIKKIQVIHAKHDEDGDNIKSEIPASVKYHHFAGSHIKNNHSKHENTEVIRNWHKIKNNGKSTVEHTRVILNFKPQHKVAESKVIYLKHNDGKDETNLKKSALKMHFQGQTVQAASRGGFGANVDENTAKDDSLSKITKIKYSELPIKWELIKSEDKGDLTSIGINKTFTIPGKRGRFKLLHEHDDDYDVDVAHEKHTIQHYPLPKHKTVTHYYTSKYTVGRTVHGKDEKNLSLRLHKIGTNSGSSAVAHETNSDRNNNLNIGLLKSNSNHGKTELYENVNKDESNNGEIIINKFNQKINSAPVNIIKSNSIYTNAGVVNLQADTSSKHEDNTFLLNENHSDERKQEVHLDTNVSNDELAFDDQVQSFSTLNGVDIPSYKASMISPSIVTKTHNAQIKQEIVEAHDKQSLEDNESENSSKVAPVLIENRNNIEDTEPTANDKIDGDFPQSKSNELVFPLEDNIHSAEPHEIHDVETEHANIITSIDTPDATDLSTLKHGLDDENEDVSQSNPNEISFSVDDKIHSEESYKIHDAETENALTTDIPDATDLSTSSEHDIVENSSKEHSAEGHSQDDASDEIITNSKIDSQIVNKVETTPKVSETSNSDESEELTDTSSKQKVKETNASVEDEEPKTEDAIERTTENYDETTQSLSSVPIESESSDSDTVEEPKIDYASEPVSEELGNENNVTVPGIDSTVVSTVKTVPISDETSSSSEEISQETPEPLTEDKTAPVAENENKLEDRLETVPVDETSVSDETVKPSEDDVTELSSESLESDNNNIIVPTTKTSETIPVDETSISDETVNPSEDDLTELSSESLESDNNIIIPTTKTSETIPVDETSVSDETVKPSEDDVTELSSESLESDNNNNIIVSTTKTSETIPVDETSVSDETVKPSEDDVTELSSESLENGSNIIVPTTKTSETVPVSGETQVSDESEELVKTEANNNDVYNVETTSKAEDINDESVESDEVTGFSSEVLEYVDDDNVPITDEIDDKEETVPTVDVPSASIETEVSEKDDSAVPENSLSAEHSEDDENKFIPAESLELENPKDISGSLPTTDQTDLPINDLSESSIESDPENDQLGLSPDENLHEQVLKSTEATDNLNNPVLEPETDYTNENVELGTPSAATSDVIKEPKDIEPSEHIPKAEMTNDYNNDEYEVMEPKTVDKEYPYEEAHPVELNDGEEATREEQENKHPTVNVHLTRFPISGQQASFSYPSTYKNAIVYPNLANAYSLPNANSNQPNPYVTSDQYLQYILGYLTSANVMQQLKLKYAQGYGDRDKIRQMHIIGHLQNLGVQRISHEQYLVLAQNVKQLEDVQKKDNPKPEIVNDDQAVNQNLPNQYYYMPYANVYPSVQTPKLSNAYIQRYLLQNVDVNASNTAAQALSNRVLNIVTYLRKLRVPEYRISQFVTEVKKHLTPAAIQSYINDCKNKVVTGLREKIDTLAKQAMQRCIKCAPPVYALSQNYS